MSAKISGFEWVVEAYGCAPSALANVGLLQALFARMVDDLNLRPVGEPVWHRFPAAGGVTGFLVLAESHLACHTFPEYGSLCLNLFCCRQRPDWDFSAYLKREFAATAVKVRRLERPYGIDEPGCELSELRGTRPVPVV